MKPLTKTEIEDRVAFWQERLNLCNWTIVCNWKELPESSFDNAIPIAETFAQEMPYNRTSIAFNPKVLSEWPGDSWGDYSMPFDPDVVIVHELLHIAMSLTDRAAMDLIEDQLHRDAENMLRAAYNEARERFVDHLAYAIVALASE